MAEMIGIVENCLCEIGRNNTGYYVNGLALAAAGGKFSHRQHAAAHSQFQMRTVAASKFVVLEDFSIS